MSLARTFGFPGLLLSMALVAPGVASAEMHFAAGGGALQPWEGDTGYSAIGQLMASAFSDHLRIGAEFEYEDYETELLGLTDIQVNSYSLRALVQFVLFPDSISPYAGVAYGLNLVEVDDDRVDEAFGALGIDVHPLGLGTSGVGFLGVQFPIGDHFALFAEGRASVATELTDEFDDVVELKHMSGYSGMAGVRLSF